MIDNASAQRYELEENGHVAFARYRCEGNTLYIDHVEAPPELRGKGSAGRLMQCIVELAEKNKWQIVPICGYAASWLRRHTNPVMRTDHR